MPSFLGRSRKNFSLRRRPTPWACGLRLVGQSPAAKDLQQTGQAPRGYTGRSLGQTPQSIGPSASATSTGQRPYILWKPSNVWQPSDLRPHCGQVNRGETETPTRGKYPSK